MSLPGEADVYWNSRKRCFSIKPRRPQGPVQHSTGPFLLEQARFRVSEKGRQWVLRHQRKTVHATIRGYPRVFDILTLPSDARRITYNPYMDHQFMTKSGPIAEAAVVYFTEKGVFVA